jgi:hypothetical protein
MAPQCSACCGRQWAAATGLQAIGTYIHVERGGHAIVLVAEHPAHARVVLSTERLFRKLLIGAAVLGRAVRIATRQGAKTADGVWSVYAHRCARSMRRAGAALRCSADSAPRSECIRQSAHCRLIAQSAAQNSAEQWRLKYSRVGRAEPNLVIVTDLDDNRPRRCKHRVEHSRSMQPLRARSLAAAACRQSHSVRNGALTTKRRDDCANTTVARRSNWSTLCTVSTSRRDAYLRTHALWQLHTRARPCMHMRACAHLHAAAPTHAPTRTENSPSAHMHTSYECTHSRAHHSRRVRH